MLIWAFPPGFLRGKAGVGPTLWDWYRRGPAGPKLGRLRGPRFSLKNPP